jgi:hypothetical protein
MSWPTFSFLLVVVGGMAVIYDVVNDHQDDSCQHSKQPNNEHLQDYLNHDRLLSSTDQSLHMHYPASRMPKVKCQTFDHSLRFSKNWQSAGYDKRMESGLYELKMILE